MLQTACSSHLKAPCVQDIRSRARGRTIVSAALSAIPSTPTAAKPPRIQTKLHVDRMFQEVHEEMTARSLRVAHAKNLLVDAYYFRHPEDVWAILSKDDVLFAKSARMTVTREWLGDGVFTQLDPDRHAAGRALLNPAFRRDYLAQLDSFMIGSAQQLADILKAAAGSSSSSSSTSVSTAGSGSTVSTGGSTANVAPLDMQRLFRLLTLDTLGLTSLDRSFDALQLWQQQQQQHAGAQTASTAANSSSSSSSNGQLELEQLLWDLESAFLLFSLRLPVPRSWLPGWSKYIRACERLDSTINSILQETRAQQQQQQQASCAGGAEHSRGSASAVPPSSSSRSSSSSSSSRSRQTLVSCLLAAQQHQGADQIPDQQILDEIKTVMFGGVDTSAFTLSVCAHFLAQHPAAADRAAAEVAALLRASGRSSVGQLRAEDASKLPWVLACVNETMRLVPAGPAITRTALQDVELAGFTIPRGQTVVANLYSMHRHPEVWPQPDAWLPQRWIPAEAAAAGLIKRSSTSDTTTTTTSSKAQEQPFLPFSTGPRGCIGRNYGLLQMVLGLAVLLGSGVRVELPAGEQGSPLPLTKSITLHVKGGIWLVPRTAADGGV